MTRTKTAAAAGLVTALVAGAADSQSFRRAEGDFSTFLSRLEWKSGCIKPIFYGSRDVSFEYEQYARCLVRRAENDAAYARQAVIDNALAELNSVKDEARIAGYDVD
jgi:hypothetical protein